MTQFSSTTEVLTLLGDQCLKAQFSSATEVLTSLKYKRLTTQFISAIEVLTSLKIVICSLRDGDTIQSR